MSVTPRPAPLSLFTLLRPRAALAPLTLVLACLVALLATAVPETIQHDNSSLLLVNTLRRQLMKDNYDYISSDEDSPRSTVESKKNQKKDTVEEQKVTKIAAESVLTAEEEDKGSATNKKNQKNTVKEKKEVQSSEEIDNQSKSDVESKEIKHSVRRNHSRKFGKRRKKRRRYLLDIDEDIAKVYQRRYSRRMSHEDSSVTYQHSYNTELTTTVTYKVLKLRNQYRRSGLPAALIQEESPGGVAVVKLGDGPFPEFRLSGARRQYMHAPAPLQQDEEEEVPPPPVNTTV